MTHNPYAVPVATVADVSKEIVTKPGPVRIAIILCWISMALGLPDVIDQAFFKGGSAMERVAHLVGMALFFVPMFTLVIVLIVCMSRGHRWARIGYALLTAFGVLLTINFVSDTFARAWYFGVLSVVGTAIDLATVALLFTAPANAFYRKRPRMEPEQ